MAEDPARAVSEALANFRKAMRKIEPELNKALRSELLVIANRIADDARSRVPSRTGTARSSIRGGVSGNKVYIQGGKNTVPYYAWLDFGSRTPVKGNARSVGPWSDSKAGPKKGRYIYPAIDDNREEALVQVVRALDEIADRVLPHD